MNNFKVSDLNDLLSIEAGIYAVFPSSIPEVEIHREADARGLIAVITEYFIDPTFLHVVLLKPHEAKNKDIARQMIYLAANSPGRSASMDIHTSNILSFRTTVYREVKELGLRGGAKVTFFNDTVFVTLTDDNFSISKVVGRALDRLPAELPISMTRSKAALVSVVHQEAAKKGIKVFTRTKGDRLAVTLNHNPVERYSNATLREQIRMLKWDVPTPLVSPEKSALLSTLASQDRLQCYSVKRGVITKHSAIMKRSQGQKVLRVFGQIVYIGDDIEGITAALKQHGKTLEDLA